jgi:hypothetical protein
VPLAVSHPPHELDYVIRDAGVSAVSSSTSSNTEYSCLLSKQDAHLRLVCACDVHWQLRSIRATAATARYPMRLYNTLQVTNMEDTFPQQCARKQTLGKATAAATAAAAAGAYGTFRP